MMCDPVRVMCSNPLLGNHRLGDCEVCGSCAAKYTCPACNVKTCSLPCVTIHKKELECSGVRNKVKFKHLRNFTDMDLQSDYMLLEEIGRSVERVSKGRRPFQKNMAFKWLKLKKHLWDRGTRLYLLPPQFTRHISNSTYLDWKTGIVFWKLEWIFPQSSVGSDQSFIDSRVDETSLVRDLLQKYLQDNLTESIGDFTDKLKPYYDAGRCDAVKILMKAEKSIGQTKYFLINPALTLAENLQGKLVLEYPTFHVVLSSCITHYNIVSSDVDAVRDETRKYPYNKFKRRKTNHSMKFFSDNFSESDSD